MIAAIAIYLPRKVAGNNKLRTGKIIEVKNRVRKIKECKIIILLAVMLNVAKIPKNLFV